MPVFCSLLLPSYYSNNLSNKIDASLNLARFEILLLNNNYASNTLTLEQHYKSIWMDQVVYCLTAAILQPYSRGYDRYQ